MDNRNIFENVQLIGINESITGALGIASGSLLAFLGLNLIVKKYKINKKINNKNKMKKRLDSIASNDTDLRDVYKNIKEVKIVDPKYLLNKLNKEEEINKIKYHRIVCAIILDRNNNILAYAINDLTKCEMGYCIYNDEIKLNEKSKKYINALFELEFGIIGTDLNSFIKNTSKFNELEVSEEEYNKLLNSANELANNIHDHFEKNKKYHVSVQYGNNPCVSVYDKKHYIRYSPETLSNDELNDITNYIYKDISEYLIKLGFTKSTEYFIDNDNYPYIFINVLQGTAGLELGIEFTKNIKVV